MRSTIAFFSLIFSSYAIAGLEVYSAIEDESEGAVSTVTPTRESNTAPVAAPARSKSAKKAAPAKKVAKAAPAARKQQPQSAAPAPVATYDAVPEAQAQAIAKRLKLVETLIVRHGRAYDYRALTLDQLEKLVADLERSQSTGLAQVPAPAPAQAPVRAPADSAPVAAGEDSLTSTQSAPAAEAVIEEKPQPEIPPPSYNEDEGSLAPAESAE